MREQLATILPSPLRDKERGGKTVYPQISLCVPTGLLHSFRAGSKGHLLCILYKSALKTLARAHSQILLPSASRLFDQTTTKTPSRTRLKEVRGTIEPWLWKVATALNVIVRGLCPLVSYWHRLNGTDQSRTWTERGRWHCRRRTNYRLKKKKKKMGSCLEVLSKA